MKCPRCSHLASAIVNGRCEKCGYTAKAEGEYEVVEVDSEGYTCPECHTEVEDSAVALKLIAVMESGQMSLSYQIVGGLLAEAEGKVK